MTTGQPISRGDRSPDVWRPLVSVTIPTYNAARWIRETLDSALSQTYRPLDVVVVDDASTDDTLEVVRKHCPDVRVFRNPKNAGVARSRNSAIQESRGEYVALLDHDDLWHPNKLAKQMALFEKDPALGLVFSDCFYQTPDKKPYRSFEFSPPFRGPALHALLEENFIPCLTAVIPKRVLEQVGRFREDLEISEDYELFLRIARRFPIGYVDEPLATYRIHGGNFSHRRDIYHREFIFVLEMYGSEMPLRGEIALQYLWLARVQFKKGQIADGLRSLARFLIRGISHPMDLTRALSKAWKQRTRLRRLQ